MMDIRITDLAKTIDSLFQRDYQFSEGRYQSWDLCYKHFQENIFKRKNLNEQSIDHAALMLAFYLASWGMYRGSSFLLKEYTYTIHKKAIDILFSHRDILNQETIKNPNILFDTIISELTEYYLSKKLQVSSKQVNNISQTLISKIIMGTTGLMPAYDRNVKKELKRRNLSQSFSKKGYQDLLKLYEKNQTEINKLSKKYKYPPMKILDMYLWEKGSKTKD